MLAPSGLNLRQSESVSSQKLTKILYGGKITIEENSSNTRLTVDQIEGHMVKVSYNDTLGYIFEGYLSHFPAPKKKGDLPEYVETIRSAGYDVLLGECEAII